MANEKYNEIFFNELESGMLPDRYATLSQVDYKELLPYQKNIFDVKLEKILQTTSYFFKIVTSNDVELIKTMLNNYKSFRKTVDDDALKRKIFHRLNGYWEIAESLLAEDELQKPVAPAATQNIILPIEIDENDSKLTQCCKQNTKLKKEKKNDQQRKLSKNLNNHPFRKKCSQKMRKNNRLLSFRKKQPCRMYKNNKLHQFTEETGQKDYKLNDNILAITKEPIEIVILITAIFYVVIGILFFPKPQHFLENYIFNNIFHHSFFMMIKK